MVWAIDLDDGTMIKALGDNVDRAKDTVIETPLMLDCFGTGEQRDTTPA